MDKQVYSPQKLVEMHSWAMFPGFAGFSCRYCGKTANLPGNTERKCPLCGRENGLVLGGNGLLHENPDIGPTKEEIESAISKIEEMKLCPSRLRLRVKYALSSKDSQEG